MKEPRRLLDTSDVPDDVARILRAGSKTSGIPAGVTDRAKRRLAAAAIPAAASVLLGWKGLALAGVLVVSAVAAHAVVTREAAHPERVTPSPVVTSTTEQDAGPPRAPEVLAPVDTPQEEPVEEPRPAPVDAGRASLAAPASTDTLASELALIGRGRSELDGNPAAALRTLDEHARHFPNGKLTIERELLALDALDRLGRNGEARERARRLLGRAKGTIYEARVRAYLEHSP